MSVAVIDRNDVVLRGLLSAPAVARTLPSGDLLITFRLVVRRPEPRVRGQSVDVLACITYDRGRAAAALLAHGHRHRLGVRGELPARPQGAPVGSQHRRADGLT